MKFIGNNNEREWEEEMMTQRFWTIVNVNSVQGMSLDPLMEQLKSLFTWIQKTQRPDCPSCRIKKPRCQVAPDPPGIGWPSLAADQSHNSVWSFREHHPLSILSPSPDSFSQSEQRLYLSDLTLHDRCGPPLDVPTWHLSLPSEISFLERPATLFPFFFSLCLRTIFSFLPLVQHLCAGRLRWVRGHVQGRQPSIPGVWLPHRFLNHWVLGSHMCRMVSASPCMGCYGD